MRRTYKELPYWTDGYWEFEYDLTLLTIWIKELKVRLSERKKAIRLRAFTGYVQ